MGEPVGTTSVSAPVEGRVSSLPDVSGGRAPVAVVSRLRPGVDGEDACTVECARCGLVLRQIEEFDRDIALGTFFSSHPASPDAIHQSDVPAGWSVVGPAVA